jgi:hypothetical protein
LGLFENILLLKEKGVCRPGEIVFAHELTVQIAHNLRLFLQENREKSPAWFFHIIFLPP